jgi:hypothetical protein
MNNEIDGLKEVCETVQIVQTEEQNIATIEKQIADKMRAITAKIFDGSTKYRIPIQKMCNEDNDISYWAFGVVLQDKIFFNGNFYGNAQTMRVDRKGKIWTLWQNIGQRSAYSLMTGEDMHIDPYAADIRPSSNYEIATHAQELASELLEALKTRIDTMKTEKATLQKMVQAIL